MSIVTWDGYVAAPKQALLYNKTGTVTTVANNWFSNHTLAGSPGAGVLAASATVTTAAASAGVVPTDTLAGCPFIDVKTGSYYLSRIKYLNSVASQVLVYDRLWHVNMATATLGTGTITAPASYAGRLPAGSFNNLLIVLEITTAIAASAVTVSVTYTNQSGTAGRTTGASASLSGFTVNRWVFMPLQSGDSGVQLIQNIVVGGVAAATGAFNIAVIRPLWFGNVGTANTGGTEGFDQTGAPEIYVDSCLQVATLPLSTSSGAPTMILEVASG